MNPDTPRALDVRRYAVAVAHGDAHPRRKKAAANNAVTTRTERRWRTPADAKGSPLDRYSQYLETAQDPWRLLACNRVTVIQRTLQRWTNAQITDRIRELLVEDAIVEGIDNANRFRRGLSMLDRAVDSERDAAVDLELTALYRECAARNLGEVEIFGS